MIGTSDFFFSSPRAVKAVSHGVDLPGNVEGASAGCKTVLPGDDDAENSAPSSSSRTMTAESILLLYEEVRVDRFYFIKRDMLYKYRRFKSAKLRYK